jgi:hypothetical protein
MECRHTAIAVIAALATRSAVAWTHYVDRFGRICFGLEVSIGIVLVDDGTF